VSAETLTVQKAAQTLLELYTHLHNERLRDEELKTRLRI
jgi:hypothetical protein